ncbi:MAG: inorganic diphosphatase [Candidatus Sericytochromatia bacterium]|nr:inorganic diphosphatase [Candidatus Sericytochromatia bacterium]
MKPDLIEAVVEQPRGSFIKRGTDGRIAIFSPVPCPYNYGCLPATTADDGDPIDAIVLGPRLPVGTRVHLPLVAWVEFIDDGVRDYKLVLSQAPLNRGEERGLIRFFRLYVILKRVVAMMTGRRGATTFVGVHRDLANLRKALPAAFRNLGP